MRQRLADISEFESKRRVLRRIWRDKTKEVFYCHAGDQAGSSLRTILRSSSQLRLMGLATVWYACQTFTYLVLANLLVYCTMSSVLPDSPSYPGAVSKNGSDPFVHRELYDTGFFWTPDLSYRPFLLKTIFVDAMVTIAQLVPPVLLVGSGLTRELVSYTGLVGIQNIMKGVVQLATILPAARGGEGCWELNFKPEELAVVRTQDFVSWGFTHSWGMTHGCNDMLWSGHTSQSCIGLLFLDKSLRHHGVPAFVRGILAVYFAVYIWAVLACRMHYSIDVLVAALIALVLYTHSPLRFSIWVHANSIVGNEPFSEGFESFSESSSENEDLENGVELLTPSDRAVSDVSTAS